MLVADRNDHTAPKGLVPGGTQDPEGGQAVVEPAPGARRALRQRVAERAVRDADQTSLGEPGGDLEERADRFGVPRAPKGGGVVPDDGVEQHLVGALSGSRPAIAGAVGFGPLLTVGTGP